MDEEEKDERQHGLQDWRGYISENEYGSEEKRDESGRTVARRYGVGSATSSDAWASTRLWWAADEYSASTGAQARQPRSQRGTGHEGAVYPLASGGDRTVPTLSFAEPRPRAQSSVSVSSILPETDEAKRERRRGRTCKADGCSNYIVHKGLCCRHGGGKKCSADGCESSAKHKGRCWRHGGSVECKRLGCKKRAKARGLCWGHCGGMQCSTDGCEKVAVSNSLCWAHGGGKRCIYDGCQRPAYARTHDFCKKHYEELQDVDYYEV